MSLDASTLQVLPNLHRAFLASHGLQNIFGKILLTMHNIQSVWYEDVLHIQNIIIIFCTYNFVNVIYIDEF